MSCSSPNCTHGGHAPSVPCFSCANELTHFDVLDNTGDWQAFSGVITIPAGALTPGCSFYLQTLEEITHLGTTNGNRTGFLALILNGDFVNPFCYQAITLNNLALVRQLNNPLVGGSIITPDAGQPNLYAWSNLTGTAGNGVTAGLCGISKFGITLQSFGGWGIGQGGYSKSVQALNVPLSFQWWWKWDSPTPNEGIIFTGYYHRLWIVR